MHVKSTRKQSKIEDHNKSMAFLSYEVGSKSYGCLDPATFKVEIIFEM